MLSVCMNVITTGDRERSRGAEGSSEEGDSGQHRGLPQWLSRTICHERPETLLREESPSLLAVVRKGLLTQKLWRLQTLIT